MAVCALQRGGEAAHHIKRAFRMDRQNRGLVHAGPAGSYDHCSLYCRGPDFFSFFLTAPPASAFSQGLPESSLRYRLAQKCITLPSLLCYCCWLPLTYFASILIDNSTPSGLIKPGWLFRCRFFESPEDAVFWQVCILRYSKLQQRYRTQMPWEV